MDLYGDNIDSLLDRDALNENIRDENISDDENQGNKGEEIEENDDEEKNADGDDAPKPVEPKKRAVRNPQVKR